MNTTHARALETGDLGTVVAIDEKVTGQTRKDYWRGFHHGPMVQLERSLEG